MMAVVVSVTASCAKDVSFQKSPVTPAATAEAELGRDENGNVTVAITVEHLADPADLDAEGDVYVAWAETKDGKVANLGQLTVGDDLEGTLETITPFEKFKILITAETTTTVQTPSDDVILQTDYFAAENGSQGE
jgi:hypothetical protein